MKNKSVIFAILLVCVIVPITTCATNPMTGKRTMAFISNTELFPMAFQQYDEFLSESNVITGTDDAEMVKRVGDNIRMATEKWFIHENDLSYLNDYKWEYHLVESDEINAWCMPGGKIVVYSGILPVTQNEAALATVLGHELAHALLNHGQQRMSAGILQQLGATTVNVLFDSDLFDTIYGLGTTLAGTLPFSRKHESEADHFGLILMAIAGYDPDESVPFWQRMAALGSSGPEFLSTHPSPTTRISDLKKWIPEAQNKAIEVNRVNQKR